MRNLSFGFKVSSTLAGLFLLSMCHFVEGAEYYQWNPGHYILLKGTDPIDSEVLAALNNENFKGIQRKYLWRDLEPTQGNYDFSLINADLNALPANKFLIIQIQLATFDGTRAVPTYMQGITFGGGDFAEGNDGLRYYAMIWRSDVRQRLYALFDALATSYKNNPKVESLVLPETAVSDRPHTDAEPCPLTDAGYSRTLMRDSCIWIMRHLRDSFPVVTSATAPAKTKTIIQYVNRMLPTSDNAKTNCPHDAFTEQDLIQAIADEAATLKGVGIGGPDAQTETVLPSYPVITTSAGVNPPKIPVNMSVQYADYLSPNTLNGVWNFGLGINGRSTDGLYANYMTWLYTNGSGLNYRFGLTTDSSTLLTVRHRVANTSTFPNSELPVNMGG